MELNNISNENNIIYGLFCPILNKPVYIGQSIKGLSRTFFHIKEKSHNEKVNEWIRLLRFNHNKEPLVVILESFFPKEFINEKESFWINKFISEGNLLLNIQSVSPLIVDSNTINGDAINSPISNIAYFVKCKRKQLKLTQEDLALNAGVGLRFIRDLEQGTKTNFQTDSINKVLNLFGSKLDVSKIIP